MKNYYWLLALFFAFFVLKASVSFATPHVKISESPSWILTRQPDLNRQPARTEISDGYYFILTDNQINVGLQERFYHSIKKIINESGVQIVSQLSIGFHPDYQQLTFHKIVVKRDGKEINKLNLSRIRIINQEPELASYQISGTYSATIIFDDIRKGDEIELSYTIKGFNPIYENIFCDNFNLASVIPITNNFQSIIIPSQRRLNFKYFNNAEQPTAVQQNGNTIYDWPDRQITAYTFATDVPSWYIGYPYVEVSEFKNWNEVAIWADNIVNHYQYTLSGELKNKINQWHDQSQGNIAKFAGRATQFVQDDIRYMGIEIGANSHKPHSPIETFNKRYGDCKDKSLLLCAILRTQQIPAFIGLISTHLQEHISEHLPSTLWFDHAIVTAKVDGVDVWIDPTNSLQRGEILNIAIPNYGKSLVIDANTSTLTSVEIKGAGITHAQETFTIPADNQSKATLDVETTYSYASADGTRNYLSANSFKDIEKEFENFYQSIYPHTQSSDDIKYEDDTVNNILTLYESYKIDSIWTKSSDKKTGIVIAAKSLYTRLPKPNESDLTNPLALAYPSTFRYKAIIKMPRPWSLETEDYSIERSAYKFSFTSRIYDSTITLEYYFESLKDNISPQELPLYLQDYKKMTASMEYSFSYNEHYNNQVSRLKNDKSIFSNTNWIMVFIAIVTVVAVFLFLKKMSAKQSNLTSQTEIPETISGWLILLAVILVIRIIIYLYQFIAGHYFETTSWLALNELGATGLQLLLVIEMAVQASFVIYACFIFYWFVMRRDIFPKAFIILLFAELGTNILFLIFYAIGGKTIDDILPGYTDTYLKLIFRNMLGIAIWGTAVYKSPLVKRVFIKPYRYLELQEDPGYRDFIDAQSGKLDTTGLNQDENAPN
ncbi:MAG: DUF3857 domain-containing protein [Bacteroidetes bacterium]|nr:DUF3857 domain-containing protein [Bacteroidota bacterium]